MSRLHDALGARREPEARRSREEPRSLHQLGWRPSSRSGSPHTTAGLVAVLLRGLLWAIWWAASLALRTDPPEPAAPEQTVGGSAGKPLRISVLSLGGSPDRAWDGVL